MTDNQVMHNGDLAPVDTDTDAMVWEEPVQVRNRVFPGPGLSLRIVRRGDSASLTFSPDLVKESGLTDGCRVIFGWDPQKHRLGIMQGFGSKVSLQPSGNAVVSKAMPPSVLDDLMQGKELVFFTPVVIPGSRIIIVARDTAHDPWSAGAAPSARQLPRFMEQQLSEEAETTGRSRQDGGRTGKRS